MEVQLSEADELATAQRTRELIMGGPDISGIYGLKFTRDNVIRYVGQATNMPRRFREHYRGGYLTYPKDSWIAAERREGYDVSFCVLECFVLPSELNIREKYWIRRLPKLRNIRLNNRYDPNLLSSWDRDRINTATETITFRENWLGHVGIRHYPEFESWCVFVSYGNHYYNNFVQLPGDGGPISMRNETYKSAWGHTRYRGDGHFSDPIDAIKARDRYRAKLDETNIRYSQPPINWPADRCVG